MVKPTDLNELAARLRALVRRSKGEPALVLRFGSVIVPGRGAQQRGTVGPRFHRAPGTQVPGSGLGLSIVQRIVDLHRGTLQLETLPAGIGLRAAVAPPRAAE